MITILYSVEKGEVIEKTFDTGKDYEQFCRGMERRYGFNGWEIHNTERW